MVDQCVLVHQIANGLVYIERPYNLSGWLETSKYDTEFSVEYWQVYIVFVD